MKKICLLVLLIVASFGCENEPVSVDSVSFNGIPLSLGQRDRLNEINKKFKNDSVGIVSGKKAIFKSFDELDTFFKKLESGSFSRSGKVKVSSVTADDIDSYRLLSARIQTEPGATVVSANFPNFGPSAINFHVEVSYLTNPDGVPYNPIITIQPYGYYLGSVNTSNYNVSSSGGQVTWQTSTNNTYNIGTPDVNLGTYTALMNASFTYNPSTGYMSYQITSSSGY